MIHLITMLDEKPIHSLLRSMEDGLDYRGFSPYSYVETRGILNAVKEETDFSKEELEFIKEDYTYSESVWKHELERLNRDVITLLHNQKQILISNQSEEEGVYDLDYMIEMWTEGTINAMGQIIGALYALKSYGDESQSIVDEFVLLLRRGQPLWSPTYSLIDFLSNYVKKDTVPEFWEWYNQTQNSEELPC